MIAPPLAMTTAVTLESSSALAGVTITFPSCSVCLTRVEIFSKTSSVMLGALIDFMVDASRPIVAVLSGPSHACVRIKG